MVALIPVLVWICCQSQPMNMLALGETSARQLGLPLWFWRNLLVVATGWMVGVSVALAGAIGFIGLVIPHILRLCGLTDHRVLLRVVRWLVQSHYCLLMLSRVWCWPRLSYLSAW